VCNDRRNCLFLEARNLLGIVDYFLLRTIGPWLLRLHTDCTREQLRDFVNKNHIGILPLAANSQVLLHITNGMALSSRNLHEKYEILGIPGFEIPKV
jgi:hypothetical protein